MYAFSAVADKKQKLDISIDELESAMWFSRLDVKEALERVEADPYFKGIKEWPHKHDLRYIP
uniref:Uncharacterized protein n=1 Tax=Acrobeloides nanus TaxID=290746 RepID=A0A914DH38_9BILA